MLGDRLKDLRKVFNLGAVRAASIAGVSKTMYLRYEAGGVKPKADVCIRLCRYYNVPADFLLETGVFREWTLIEKNSTRILDFLRTKFPLLDLEEIHPLKFIKLINQCFERISFCEEFIQFEISYPMRLNKSERIFRI